QTTLRVKVVDATDQTPQKQADVIVKAVDGYPHIQRTDDQGYAEFPVPFGTFDVHGHQMDYDSGSATVEVQTEAGADVTLGLRYHPQIWG
ncbi:MAG: hypothetical protein FWC59_01455, partial [Actinomycetia bacterium]|nr:hypothetical protein [Actinomycetes bacterium]